MSVPNRSPELLLIAIAKHGDRSAFSELFCRFAPSIKGYLLHGGASPALVDDLVQDVMFAVWHKAASFDASRATAATWIFAIARNRRIDAFRRERHFEPLDDDLAAPYVSTAEAGLAESQTAEAVRAAIQDLPPDQAHVLREAYWGDKSLASIAASESIPLGTIKSRVRLALQRLRARIDPAQEP